MKKMIIVESAAPSANDRYFIVSPTLQRAKKEGVQPSHVLLKP